MAEAVIKLFKLTIPRWFRYR